MPGIYLYKDSDLSNVLHVWIDSFTEYIWRHSLSCRWTIYDHGIIRCSKLYTNLVHYVFDKVIHSGAFCTAQTHIIWLHTIRTVLCNDFRCVFHLRRRLRANVLGWTSLSHCERRQCYVELRKQHLEPLFQWRGFAQIGHWSAFAKISEPLRTLSSSFQRLFRL